MQLKTMQLKTMQLETTQLKTTAEKSHGETDWLEEPARVVAIFTGGVWVETEPRAACSGCAAQQGCASGLLARWRRTPQLELLTDEKLHVGERVTIGLPAGQFLRGALVVYGWPLLLAIIAGGLAEQLSPVGHISVPLVFVGGLVLGLVASRFQLHRHQRHYRPHLLCIERSE